MTEPALPALALDGLEAVVFDTDGVLTDTASVHAAAGSGCSTSTWPCGPRGARNPSGFRGGRLPALGRWAAPPRRRRRLPRLPGHPVALGDPDDPPDRETVCGLGNAKDRSFVAHLREHGAEPFPTSVAFARRLRERGLGTAVVS